jgi:hypothetical protein
MGAYDNPRIIQPPNYTEIFMKNFAAGQAVFDKAFEGVRKKKKERETKLDKAYQDTSTIRVKGQAINAGDMTANIRKQTNTIADDFYANELAYIDEKIDRQTYQTNRDKHLGKLQGMVDIGGELSKVDLSNIKVSRHQKDKGKTLGLIEAYNSQAVDIDYSGDLPKLYYMDPNNNRVEVDLGVLKNIKPEDLDINEVFNIDEATSKGLIENTFNHTKNMNTVTVTDGAETIKMQVYQDGEYKTKEDVLNANKAYEEGVINSIDGNLSNFYNNLDADDRGSLFADRTFASYTMGKNENNTFQPGQEAILDNVLSKIDGITDENIKHVKEQLLNGTYNGTDEQLAIMDQVSKDSIAHQLFNTSAVPKAINQSIVKSEQQIEDEEMAREMKGIQLDKLRKGDDDDETPSQSYVDLNYKSDTYAPAVRRGINLLLKDGPKLELTNQASQTDLLDQLQSLTASQIGDVESNHFNNMMTIADLEAHIKTYPERYTESSSKYKQIGTGKGEEFNGRYQYGQFVKYLEQFPNKEQIIQLPTIQSKGQTYFNIADIEGMKPIPVGDDKVNNMANLLREAKIFMDVPVNILYDELKLFEENPNRFNK